MKTTCALVQARLPGLDAVDELGERLSAHVAMCLACQAETARYRSLRRHLGALADETLAAPPTLLPAVAAGIAEPAETVASRRLTVRQAVTVTAAAGAAVAAAAGTVIVIGLRRAHRAA